MTKAECGLSVDQILEGIRQLDEQNQRVLAFAVLADASDLDEDISVENLITGKPSGESQDCSGSG